MQKGIFIIFRAKVKRVIFIISSILMLNALCRGTIFSTLKSSCEVIYSCCALTFLYSYPFMSVFICSHVLFFLLRTMEFSWPLLFLKNRAIRIQINGFLMLICRESLSGSTFRCYLYILHPQQLLCVAYHKTFGNFFRAFYSRAIYVVSRCKHNLTLN